QRAIVGPGDMVGEEPAQRVEIDAFRTPRGHAGQPMRVPFAGASGDAGSARPYGLAGALRVARHAADGHVDTEPGRGALFPGPAPRVVLHPILTPGLESVQQLALMEPINLSDGHTGDQKGPPRWNFGTSTPCWPSPSRAPSPPPPTCCRLCSRTCPSRSASSKRSWAPICWC